MAVDLTDLFAQLWRLIAMVGGLTSREPVVLIVPPADPGPPWPAIVTGIAAVGAAWIAVRQFQIGRYDDRVEAVRTRTTAALADALGAAIDAMAELARSEASWVVRGAISHQHPGAARQAQEESVLAIDKAVAASVRALRNQRPRVRTFLRADTPQVIALDVLANEISLAQSEYADTDFGLDTEAIKAHHAKQSGRAQRAFEQFEGAVQEYAQEVWDRPRLANLWRLRPAKDQSRRTPA